MTKRRVRDKTTAQTAPSPPKSAKRRRSHDFLQVPEDSHVAMLFENLLNGLLALPVRAIRAWAYTVLYPRRLLWNVVRGNKGPKISSPLTYLLLSSLVLVATLQYLYLFTTESEDPLDYGDLISQIGGDLSFKAIFAATSPLVVTFIVIAAVAAKLLAPTSHRRSFYVFRELIYGLGSLLLTSTAIWLSVALLIAGPGQPGFVGQAGLLVMLPLHLLFVVPITARIAATCVFLRRKNRQPKRRVWKAAQTSLIAFVLFGAVFFANILSVSGWSPASLIKAIPASPTLSCTLLRADGEGVFVLVEAKSAFSFDIGAKTELWVRAHALLDREQSKGFTIGFDTVSDGGVEILTPGEPTVVHLRANSLSDAKYPSVVISGATLWFDSRAVEAMERYPTVGCELKGRLNDLIG